MNALEGQKNCSFNAFVQLDSMNNAFLSPELYALWPVKLQLSDTNKKRGWASILFNSIFIVSF
jgi:hypothetical protein